MKTKNIGLLLVGSGAFVYGLEPIFAKLCYATGFSISTLLFTRFLLAAIILMIFAMITKKQIILPKNQLKIGILLGVVSTLTTATLFKAFELLPSALAITFFYIYPSLTNIFARVFNKVPLTKTRVLALLTCLFGFVLLYWGSFELDFDIIGIFYAVLAALFMAVLMLLLEKHMPEVDKIAYSSTVYLVSAVIYFTVSIINSDIILLTQIETMGWLHLLLLVLIATLLSNLLLFYGMNTSSAVDASILNSLEIPSATLFSFIIFGDVFVGWQIVGAILIVIAAITPAVTDKMNLQKKKDKKHKLPLKEKEFSEA